MATTIAVNRYPFKIAYDSTPTSSYLSGTTGYDYGSNLSEVVFRGKRRHTVNLRMSPYAQQQVGSGFTTDLVKTTASQYASSTGLSLYEGGNSTSSPSGTGAYNVAYKNCRYSLEANSYITGYRVDTNTGDLTVNMETVDYDISGTSTGYLNDLVFEQQGTGVNYLNGFYEPAQDNKRWRLKQNLVVRKSFRGDPLGQLKENERVALETLREMVSEKDFRKYLRYGFVVVPGDSGAQYQVFRNRSHTKVWKGGKLIEEVCVRIKSGERVPPTDNVIAFMAMIRTDEEEFKKCGNVYKMAKAA